MRGDSGDILAGPPLAGSGRAAGPQGRDLRDGPRIGLHGYLKPLKKLYLHYQPLGVVGVITLGCGELTFVMPSR
jgi:hypothetical protein